MNPIIENLKAFNRKERFFLIGAALGNPQFKLCQEFKNAIEEKLNLDIPQDYFSAMDYHLDWVYASLIVPNNSFNQVYPNAEKIIHASCEDIDFLVAYEHQNICHMIFLEAKGVTLFSNEQLQSKITRLKEIFGVQNENYGSVVPHFAIVSPKEPQKLKINNWPDWAAPEGQVKWIYLGISNGLKKIVRCNETGKADKKGQYWVVKPGEY